MGLFDRITNIFKKKDDSNRFKAIESDLKQKFDEKNMTNEVSGETQQLTIDRDSVQLGMAAGYTGRSIKDMESSLTRIESQMVSKDWFTIRLEEERKLYQQLFDNLSQRLDSLYQLLSQRLVKSTYREEKLSSKMAELISIVKEAKEISYEELARRLNIQISALRGLLSNILKRNEMIERFSIDNKGWVRYIGDDSSDLNRYMAYDFSGERALAFSFEGLIGGLGYKIIEKNAQKTPDYVLEKEGKKIGVELKISANINSIQMGIGQLLVAKNNKSLDEMWLVFPNLKISEDLLGTIKSMGMNAYLIKEGQLVEAS